MKKYFLFAAVAGMLASCSSESLTAGSDPKVEPTQEDRVPIEIGVASVQTKATTRGTGPVGGISDGDNKWKRQEVNVFMFNKNGLNKALEDPADANSVIYYNTLMTTPNGESSGYALEYLDAGKTNIKHRYYPQRGNFDFWGYYIDNALAPAPAAIDSAASEIVDGDKDLKVPFVIDGTQDLMVAKAVPTTGEGSEIAALGDRPNDFYSAYAARKQVQPNLTFKHLLTQLTFTIKGGTPSSCGWSWNSTGNTWEGPTTGEKYTGVFINSIKIKSQTTGYIVAAYTRGNMSGDDRYTKADKLIKFDDTDGDADNLPDNYVDLTLQGEGGGKFYSWLPAAVAEGYLTVTTADNDEYAELYKAIGTPEDASVEGTSWTYTPVKLKGAMLLQPRDSYVMEIKLGQYLLDIEDTDTSDDSDGDGNPNETSYIIKYNTIDNIPVALTPATPGGPIPGFEAGKAYNLNITVYGNEEIKIKTTLTNWVYGGNVTVEYD